MKYPKLVPPRICTMPIKIHLTDGIDKGGAPKVVQTFETKCNYSEKSKQILDAERRLIQLEATVLIDGDIAPNAKIEGYVEIGTVSRTIYRSSRARNPDGTVNFTQLELM